MSWDAYVDDSWDERGIYVLGGYIASTEQWTAFSSEWKKLLHWGTLDGRDEYHFKMSEMALSEERMRRLPAFHHVINKYVEVAISCALLISDIDAALARVRPVLAPNVEIGLTNKSPFIVASTMLINEVANEEVRRKIGFDPHVPVNFTFDRMADQEALMSGWSSWREAVSEERSAPYGSLPRFQNDQNCAPIQAADFRAWWVRETIGDPNTNPDSRIEYPYKVASKPIHHVHLNIKQDKIVENIINVFRERQGVVLEDVGPVDYIRESSLIDRGLSKMKGLFDRRARKR